MDLKLHDIVELKKDHPCGSRRWEVLRVGMDIRLRCAGCGHEVLAPRRKVEKSIKGVPHAGYYKEQIVRMNTLEDMYRITEGIRRDLI